MTPRSIRRAEERKVRKEMARTAAKETNRAAAAATTIPTRTIELTEARLSASSATGADARRQTANGTDSSLGGVPDSATVLRAFSGSTNAHAQLSTGPATPEGRAKSSLNAVTTGLIGRTILLPTEEAAAYTQLVTAYHDELQPVGQRESDLVQSIADTAWRLKRIPALEHAIFAHGHLELADQFEDEAPANRAARIELETFFKYQKQLRNLQLQEARLARRREKETAELRQLQQERRAQEQSAAAEQALQQQPTSEPPAVHPAPQPQPCLPAPTSGFEFSTPEFAPQRDQVHHQAA